MRGKKGFLSLLVGKDEEAQEKLHRQVDKDGKEVRVVYVEDKNDVFERRRRRRHSSGDRETWSRKVEYFFAGLGYAVGMGNIWRFPYLCYRNGGGAFLIPYLLSLVVVGFPMLMMEMSFGQFASLGPITIWRVCPIFKGIGVAVVVLMIMVNVYYNVLIAYGLFYLFSSITSELPWSHCNNKWNTKYCIVQRHDYDSSANNISVEVYNKSAAYNQSLIPNVLLKTPTEEFFENHLLSQTSGIHDLGSVQWPLIVCLAVSWFTCFLCLFKGIKSMGKIVIFTTLFSYAILTVLLIRGVTLEGAWNGILFYLKPDFRKLKSLQVWGEACAQAFASLSLGGGGWITLSSYNKFTNKCNRDAIIVGAGNALTSIYSGFVIFSVLGYMAHIKNVDVADVTRVGPGLTFVAYPEGLALIPGAPFWSICFFFMMFTVGLDSLFGQVETIVAGFIDEYPELLRPRRKLFTLFICVFMFLLGIPLVSQGGIYIVTLMDWYTLLFSFSIISLFEVIVITYIYGIKQFATDIELMMGSRPNYYFMGCWYCGTPVGLVCVIAFLGANYVPAYYGEYHFPPYAESIGLALALLPCSLILIVAAIQFVRGIGSFQRLKDFFKVPDTRRAILTDLITPTAEWGPHLPENRRRYSSGGSSRKPHPSGQSALSDNVFGDGEHAAELLAINPLDPENPDLEEKTPIVRFSDDVDPREKEEKTKEEKMEEGKTEEKKEEEKVEEKKDEGMTEEKKDEGDKEKEESAEKKESESKDEKE